MRKVLLILIVMSAWGPMCSAGKGKAPAETYAAINADVQRVEAYSESEGWVVFGEVDRVVNLLELRGGICETLLADEAIPAGSYREMRLILGADNTVELGDGRVCPLRLPSGNQLYFSLEAGFEVSEGVREDVLIDFGASKAIFVHQVGKKAEYMLRPTVSAVAEVVWGSISGKLTEGVTGKGLAGAAVTVQTADESGRMTIVGSAVTDGEGRYLVDGLGVGQSYFVVCQPMAEGRAYEAKASGVLVLTAEEPVASWDAVFDGVTSVCLLMGEVLPGAMENESDVVYLRQALGAGEEVRSFIVRSTVPTFWGMMEIYLFTEVPRCEYSVEAVRTAVQPDGTVKTYGVMTYSLVNAMDTVMNVELAFQADAAGE